MTNNNEKIGYIELISAMILSGTIGVFVTLSKQPVVNIVFYRCIIGALCLFIYISLKGHLKNQIKLPRNEWVLISVIGILASDKANFITGTTMVADGGWSSGKLI